MKSDPSCGSRRDEAGYDTDAFTKQLVQQLLNWIPLETNFLKLVRINSHERKETRRAYRSESDLFATIKKDIQ